MRNKICKELNNTDIGKLVNLCGWVDRRREHGGVIFIDLRDHSGFLQITINPDDGADLFKPVSYTHLTLPTIDRV